MTPKFMMLAVENGAEFAELSAEEMQAIIKRYVAWTDRMHSAGHLLDSNKLRALQTWPYRGIPDSPGAWQMQVPHIDP